MVVAGEEREREARLNQARADLLAVRAYDVDQVKRDLEVLDGLAAGSGLRRRRMFAMPSNNFLLIWAKETE